VVRELLRRGVEFVPAVVDQRRGSRTEVVDVLMQSGELVGNGPAGELEHPAEPVGGTPKAASFP
jgi:hypothetical protein